jgi:hypothetical protein
MTTITNSSFIQLFVSHKVNAQIDELHSSNEETRSRPTISYSLEERGMDWNNKSLLHPQVSVLAAFFDHEKQVVRFILEHNQKGFCVYYGPIDLCKDNPNVTVLVGDPVLHPSKARQAVLEVKLPILNIDCRAVATFLYCLYSENDESHNILRDGNIGKIIEYLKSEKDLNESYDMDGFGRASHDRDEYVETLGYTIAQLEEL